MNSSFEKAGYLNSDFRMFYLTGTEKKEIAGHYHDFHKILYFERGSVSYDIEGETYQLQPGDIVLVPAGEVHRPVIHGQTPYHRLILYISPDFFEHYRQQGIDLDYCFASCSRRGTHVLRIPRLTDTPLYAPLQELMQSGRPQNAPSSVSAARPLALPNNRLPFGSEQEPHNLYQTAGNATAHLYQTSVLLQFLILLADFCDGRATDFPAASGSNPQILQILSFINEHLYEELPIDRIASACFLNRSYLMHLFRKEMGCTLGSYITEKRLFTAQTLIRSGTPITEACLQSGFSGYSSFYRAYRRKFGTPPSQL